MGELSLPKIPKAGTRISTRDVQNIELAIAQAIPDIDDVETLEECRAKAAALESYLRDKKLQWPMLGAQRRIEARIGQLLGEAKPGPKQSSVTTEVSSKDDRSDFRILAKCYDGCQLKDEEWRKSRRALVKLVRNKLGLTPETPELPDGMYDVIVMDPPWPMEKIVRQAAPNQEGFDYPTMSEEQLADMKVPCAENCHVWIWTTHKFLPMTLRLASKWDMKYVCTFVWHKPGGFQPFGLPQYNCEFAVYCRRGSPEFATTKQFPTCFNAPRGPHSEKPDAFYDMVRRVTTGRRLDIFNRRYIEGFEVWGNESYTGPEA